MQIPLFIYGTLLAREVLTLVLGREFGVHEFEDAELCGYERFALPHEVFPVIRAKTGGKVRGKLIANLTRAEWKKLDHFESDFYERRKVCVRVDEKKISAFTYVGSRKNHLPGKQWNLAEFKRKHLRKYLAEIKNG